MTAKKTEDKVWVWIPDAKLGNFTRGVHQVARDRCEFGGPYTPPGCVKFWYRGRKAPAHWIYLQYADTVEALLEAVNRPVLANIAQKEQEIEALRAFLVKP